VLALALPLTAVVVGSTAAPAFASGSITAPAAEAVYDDTNANPGGTSVAVKASVTVAPGKSAYLTVNGPGYSNQQTHVTNNNIIGNQTSTLQVSITLLASRVNGKYTAVLSGDATGSRSFYTSFGPTSTPSSVTAQGSGASRVDVQWSYSGTETDLAGFEISDGKGSTFTASPSDRSYTALYDNPTPGTYDYQYTVRAMRKSGNGGSDIPSAWSSPQADAQLVTPQPPPSPTPTPSAGGGTTGGTTGSTTGGTTGASTGGTTGSTTGGTSSTTGGSTGGGSTTSGGSTGSASRPVAIPTLPPLVASRRNFALSFNHFSPSLGIPKLPPLPATKFPVTAAGSEAFNPTLPYTAQPRKTTSVLTSPLAAFTDRVDTAKLATCLAFALILLAAAAHVRVFLSHDVED